MNAFLHVSADVYVIYKKNLVTEAIYIQLIPKLQELTITILSDKN